MANTCSRRCWPNPCSNTSDRLSNTQFEEVFVVTRPDFAKFLRLRRNMGHPQVDYNHLTPTKRGKHLTSAF